MQKRCAKLGAGLGSEPAEDLQAEGREGSLRAATMAEVVVGDLGCYLEPSSFDAPVEFIVLTAPAPEAVGHPVALTQRQTASLASSAQCALWSLTSQKYPASFPPPLEVCSGH